MNQLQLADHLSALRIGILGAGSIAEAMLTGICKQRLLPPHQIMVTNRSNDQRLAWLAERFGVLAVRHLRELVEHSDILILAMKPKDVAEACLGLRGMVRPRHLVISVIAGVSTERISEWLGVEGPVIRTMPNTSSAIGLSATGLAAGKLADDTHMQLATRLFEAIGSVYTVSEDELDIITGLSGSGPAYIYYLVEAMEGAGEQAGLPRQMARQLIVQTLIGAAHMLLQTHEEPATLRRKVTSPGGTTQAGLEVLESFQFQEAIASAVLRAAERARELGGQYR